MSTTMTIRLEPDIKGRLDVLADATHRSKSWLAAEAIREYVELNEWQIHHKWGQTPINLSALHNQIGVTGPKFGKDGAFRSITAVACDGPCMLQCYM